MRQLVRGRGTNPHFRKIAWLALIGVIVSNASGASAEAVLLRCSDSSMKIDTSRHGFAWFNSRGVNETAAQGHVRFEGKYVVYGIGNPYPMRVDTNSGQVYRRLEGTWTFAETCKRVRGAN